MTFFVHRPAPNHSIGGRSLTMPICRDFVVRKGDDQIRTGVSDHWSFCFTKAQKTPWVDPCEWCEDEEPGYRYHESFPELWLCLECYRSSHPDDPGRIARYLASRPLPPIVRDPVPGYVYFIREGDDGNVKIGWAKSPTDRLAAIQAGNERRLQIIKTIECSKPYYERELHRFYERFRVDREWFTPEVLEIEPPAEQAAA